MMLKKSHSSRTLLKGKDLSLQQLTQLNSFLDSQQNSANHVHKQIQNQIQMGKKNDQVISKAIGNINHHGGSLVNCYEEEKQKYEKLEFLVQHFEEEIYQSKINKANDLKNNIETDKLVEYMSQLTDKEKELEKIFEKSNTASYDLSKKVDSIRALRSERTIVSTLFDKIERQLCSLEHCYKVLVIQRKREEGIWQQTVQDFNRCQSAGHWEIDKMVERSQKLKQKQDLHNNAKLNSQLSQSKSKTGRNNSLFEELIIKSHQHTSSDLSWQRQKQKQKVSKIQNDIARVKKEKLIKNAFNQLGIISVKDLPVDVDVLEKKNQELLEISNQLYESTLEAEEKIEALKQQPKRNAGPSLRMTRLSKKRHSLTSYQSQINKNKRQLQEFKNICKIVLTSIYETQPAPQMPSFLNQHQEIVHYMSELQHYFENSYIALPSPKPKQRKQPKRLTYLLTSHPQTNNMSIYQQHDLLQYAKKNLERLDKTDRGHSPSKSTERIDKSDRGHSAKFQR